MPERVRVSSKMAEARRENKASQTRKADISQTANSPADRVLFLQRTIGNQAVQRLINSRVLQTKLRIGKPDDIYEQEADRIAEQIVSSSPPLQRKCAACPKDEDEGLVQHKTISDTADISIADSVIHSLGPGQPLDGAAHAFFEPRFGCDFSEVRVHTDAKAAESARAVNALAFTVGRDVVFGEGQYAPEKRVGLQLLAHELIHVVQQVRSPPSAMPQNKPVINELNDPAEQEANQVVHKVLTGDASSLAIQQKSFGLQRSVSTLCLAPFDLFTLGGLHGAQFTASAFGDVAEALIQANYCTVMGCSVMATDFFDNPIPGSYIAFLVAHNPHLNNPKDIVALALISLTGLNRPDILTDLPTRKEYYEIKPRSLAGIIAGINKLLTIQAFMASYSLPYVFGTPYTPTPPEILSGTVMVGPWPLTVSLRAERIAPGLIVYDICFTGELGKIAIAALILIVLIILTRGRLPGRIPLPAPVPVLAAAGESEITTTLAET